MAGWTSVNVRLDPYNAQTEEQPTEYEQIKAAILRVANSAPPAQREAVNLISKIGPERALALLKAGAGEIEASASVEGNGKADSPLEPKD